MIAPHPYERLPMLVLTGVGRSGTTALRQALCRHPQILGSRFEHNVVGDVLETASRNRTMQSRRWAMQVDDETHDALFRRLVFDLLFPKPANDASDRPLLIFTDLSPETASYLAETFQNIRVLCIVRSGVEVVASRLWHPSFGQDTFEHNCRAWCNAADMDAWCGRRENALVVRHETLEADPESVCDRIARFAGIQENAQPAAHLRAHRYHPTRYDGPPWAGWTLPQRRAFERICGEPMRRLGYALPWHPEAAGERELSNLADRV